MKILNFSIMAHVDHGKSTLSTRLIERYCSLKSSNEQFLDDLEVERSRGITVRSQVINLFRDDLRSINLIDTPGHVDFKGEVIKFLSVANLIIILVSALDGPQSQTRKYWLEAKKMEKRIIFIVNKIDSVNYERLFSVLEEIKEEFSPIERVFFCSSKSGTGIDRIVNFIDETSVNAPDLSEHGNERNAYVISSLRESNGGFHYLIQNKGRDLVRGEDLGFISEDNKSLKIRIRSLYVNNPFKEDIKRLRCGEIAYLNSNRKQPLRVGSIIGDSPLSSDLTANNYYHSMIIPEHEDNYEDLYLNLEELRSNDYTFNFEKIQNEIIGKGFICKTLGLLHLEVILARLEEMNSPVIKLLSLPQYKVTFKREEIGLKQDYSYQDISKVEEEKSVIDIEVRKQQWDNFKAFNRSNNFEISNIKWLGNIVKLRAVVSTWIILSSFEDLIKQCRGEIFYEEIESFWEEIRFNLLRFYINDRYTGFKIIIKRGEEEQVRGFLKEIGRGIKRGQTLINIQAKVGEKTLASEKILPYRKAVTDKCYGGDVTRKMKLLRKQKVGKKRLKGNTVITFDRKVFVKKSKRSQT